MVVVYLELLGVKNWISKIWMQNADWPWVKHCLWFAFIIFFRGHRRLVVGLTYEGRGINPFCPRNALRNRL